MTRVGYLFIVSAIAGCLFIASCTQQRQPCLTPTTSKLNIRTLQFKPGVADAVDTALPSAVFRALTVAGTKGLLFVRQSTFAVQLSPIADSSTWVIKTDTASVIYDTLVVYYSRQQHFISNACGYSYYFDLTSVHTTHQFIDSIRIINTSVTNNVNTGNLQVYIHPGT